MTSESVKLHRYALREIRRMAIEKSYTDDTLKKQCALAYQMALGTAFCMASLFSHQAQADEHFSRLVSLTGITIGTLFGYHGLKIIEILKDQFKRYQLHPLLEQLAKKEFDELSLNEEILETGAKIQDSSKQLVYLEQQMSAWMIPILLYCCELSANASPSERTGLLNLLGYAGVIATGNILPKMFKTLLDKSVNEDYLDFLLISDAEAELESELERKRTR